MRIVLLSRSLHSLVPDELSTSSATFELGLSRALAAHVDVDIISVVRHNAKLGNPSWHKAAVEGNFYLRGFNYLFVMKKE